MSTLVRASSSPVGTKPLQERDSWVLLVALSLALWGVQDLWSGLFEAARELSEFEQRAMGGAVARGVDPSGYLRTYVTGSLYFLLLFAGAASMMLILRRWLLAQRAEAEVELRWLSLLALGSAVSSSTFLIFADPSARRAETVLLTLLAVCLLFVVTRTASRSRQRRPLPASWRDLLWQRNLLLLLLLTPLPFWVLFEVMFRRRVELFSSWWDLIAYLAIVLLLLLGCGWFLRRGPLSASRLADFWATMLLPWLALPPVVPLLNEVQVSLPGQDPRILVVGLVAALMAVNGLLLFRRPRLSAELLLSRIHAPLVVATFVIFRYYRHQISFSVLDYFHLGERTLPTQQLFSFGKLPFFDLRPAHFASDFLFQTLQTAIQGYRGLDMMIWESWMPEVLAALLLYFVLARLAGVGFALLAVLFMPVLELAPAYYAPALLPALCLDAALRRPSTTRLTLLWAALGLVTFWRIDFGLASFVATLVCLAARIADRERWPRRALRRSLGAALGLALAAWLLAAMVAGRSAFGTLVFLLRSYAMRLSTRARAELTTEFDFPTVLQYYVVPGLSLVVLAWGVFRVLRRAALRPEQQMVIFLASFSLVMSVRSVERHTLVEGLNPYLAPLLLFLLPFLFDRRASGRWRQQVAAATTAVLIGAATLSPVFDLPARFEVRHLFEKEPLFALRDWNAGESRVHFPSDRHRGLLQVMEHLLTEGETFYDLTNSPLLYVLADRPFPTYVVSSLVQTGEEVQRQVIEELEETRAAGLLPLVLFKQGAAFWDTADGLASEVRSYRVAEYIYAHYEPLARVGRYELWGERESGMRSRLRDLRRRFPLPWTERPVTHNLSVVEGGAGGRGLVAEGHDPYVTSLVDLARAPAPDAWPHWQVALRYRAGQPVTLQVLYGTDGWPFSEELSQWIELQATDDWRSVTLPLPRRTVGERWTGLRFDLSAGGTVELDDVELLAGPVDLSILDADSVHQRFELGRIPYLWANHDPLEAIDRTPVRASLMDRSRLLQPGQPLRLELPTPAGGSVAGYLQLRIGSPWLAADEPPQTMLVEYGEPGRDGFRFDLVPQPLPKAARPAIPLLPSPVLHDVELLVRDGRPVYVGRGADPWMSEILDLGSLPALQGEELYLRLAYRSAAAASLELFWAFDGQTFDPQRSRIVRLAEISPASAPAELVVPIYLAAESAPRPERLANLRFDLPPEVPFELVSVTALLVEPRSDLYLVRLSTQWQWHRSVPPEIRLESSWPLRVEEVLLRGRD